MINYIARLESVQKDLLQDTERAVSGNNGMPRMADLLADLERCLGMHDAASTAASDVDGGLRVMDARFSLATHLHEWTRARKGLCAQARVGAMLRSLFENAPELASIEITSACEDTIETEGMHTRVETAIVRVNGESDSSYFADVQAAFEDSAEDEFREYMLAEEEPGFSDEEEQGWIFERSDFEKWLAPATMVVSAQTELDLANIVDRANDRWHSRPKADQAPRMR